MAGQAARQFIAGAERLVPVFDLALAFLGEAAEAIEAVAAIRDDRPGDSIPDLERATRRVHSRSFGTELGDPPQDLMPQDRGHRDLATPLQAVEVAAAERAGDDLDQDLQANRPRKVELAEFERDPGAMEDGGGGGLRQDAIPFLEPGLVWRAK